MLYPCTYGYHRRPVGRCKGPIDSWKHGKLRVRSDGGSASTDQPVYATIPGPAHASGVPDSALNGGKGGQQRLTGSPDIPT